MAIYPLVFGGWKTLGKDYSSIVRENTPDELSEFLVNLLAHGGELARLLLVLADVHRIETNLKIAHNKSLYKELGDHIILNVFGSGQPYYPESPDWTEIPDLRSNLLTQLRRCLEWLEEVDNPSN